MRQKNIIHPIAVGTKTNIGTIRSYKFVKYGISKYRYFVEGSDLGHAQEEIKEIHDI